MSGRDLRSFLNQHRSGTFHVSKNNDVLAKKFLTRGGQAGRRGLSEVNYNELLYKVKQHKETGKSQVQKVDTLSHQGQQNKEAGLLRIHREVWLHEWQRLVKERGVAEAGLGKWRAGVLQASQVQDDVCEVKDEANKERFYQEWLREMCECEVELTEEMLKFEESMVCPVNMLTQRLRSFVQGGVPVLRGQYERLCCEVESVRRELEQVWSVLEAESVLLGNHLAAVRRGWRCKEQLKECLENEMKQLDAHYQDVLKSLQERHKEALSAVYGGWAKNDAEKFWYIMVQYRGGQAKWNMREILLDRLTREFPHLSREDLVEHEKWVCSCEAYTKQSQAYIRDWHTHRAELKVKVHDTVREYERACVVKEVGLKAVEEQAQLCLRLHHKVQEWREEKQKRACLEAEQAAVLRVKQEVWLIEAVQNRREKEERMKKELRTYREKKERERVQHKAELDRLLHHVQEERDKMAANGRGRVLYRRQKVLEKLSKHEEVRQYKLECLKHREAQLELLRQQVRVQVDADPERLLQHTRATQAHKVTVDPDSPLQQPLFPVHGYMASQVTSDPRIRLENALREAGLLRNDYARSILSKIPPPSNPRPDQLSTLFRDHTS